MGKREEIMEQARALVKEIGFRQFTLELLLTRMKLSKGGFYHHFKKVNLLFEALLKEDLKDELNALRALCEREDSRTALKEFFFISSNTAKKDDSLFAYLSTDEERRHYLLLLDLFWDSRVKEALRCLLENGVQSKQLQAIDVSVVVELFEAVNRHANQAMVLELWSESFALTFHENALRMLAQELKLEEGFFQLSDTLADNNNVQENK